MSEAVAWVRFTGAWDHRVAHHTTTAYLPGMVAALPRSAAQAAIAAGMAEAHPTPTREHARALTEDPFHGQSDRVDGARAAPAGAVPAADDND